MHVVEASIMIGGLPAEQCCGIPGNVLQLIGPRSPSSWVAFHVGWVGTGNKAGATLPPSTSWHGCAAEAAPDAPDVGLGVLFLQSETKGVRN